MADQKITQLTEHTALLVDDDIFPVVVDTAGTPTTKKIKKSTVTKSLRVSRVGSTASSATPSINVDLYDSYSITALAANITSVTITGTPTNFQQLIIRIKDNATARTIAWGSSFEAKGVALPLTTVVSKVLTVKFIYDTVTSKWGCVAYTQEA